MKKLLGMAAAALLGTALLPAQTSSPSANSGPGATSFTHANNTESQLTRAIPGNGQPNAKGKANAQPAQGARPAGIAVGIYQNGAQMINPLAPARYGDGREYVTANPNRNGPSTRGGDGGDDATPTFGGLRLFGWDF